MKSMLTLLSGIIFALGLGISGMTLPQKVIGFLDVTNWDPSLAFVMVGAIAVHFIAYQFQKKMKRPKLAEQFEIPTRTDISPQLIVGAGLFGAGWGLGGFCPGPALVSLTSLNTTVFTFVGSMVAGMLLFHKLLKPILQSQQ